MDDAPFASCVVETDGSVSWANQAFWALSNSRELRTLAELETWANTKLITEQAVAPFSVSGEHAGARRYLTALHWKLPESNRVVLTFFDQTSTKQRQQIHASFEIELVRYITILAQTLQELADRKGHVAPELLAAIAEEATELSKHAVELHPIARRTTDHTTFDLSAASREVLHELEEEQHKRHLHLLVTSAPKALVRGHQADIQIALYLVLLTCMEQAPAGGTLRVDVIKHASRTEVRIQLPEVVLSESKTKRTFSFGVVDTTLSKRERIWRFKLAVTQQILMKYRAQLRVDSNPHEGTTVSLTCASAKA